MQKPMRAFLTSADGVEGRFEAYNMPGSPLWTQKGDVFGYVPRCGIGSLGGKSSMRNNYLSSDVGGVGRILQVESTIASRAASTGLVGFDGRACSASKTDRGTRLCQTRVLR